MADDIRDTDGLTPETDLPETITPGQRLTNENGPDDSLADVIPAAPAPVGSWTEVDPTYEELTGEVEGDADEDTLPTDSDDEDQTGRGAPRWVAYELWGRDLDRGTPSQLLGTHPFEGDLEVEIGQLPAGTRMEFTVRLVDSEGGVSGFSEPIHISLPTDFTPPPRPVGIFARNAMGLVVYGWEGQLEGEIPEDFSHVQFYARQMHPAGDTDGEPGDPRRMEILTEEGDRTTIALLDRIPHEIWATAVDTTGNESPWSEIVTVTPERPADTEAIEAELEAARQERDEFREDFEERTAEYDRLMSEQEDALAESDAWSHTALYRADTAAAESAAARVEASEAAGVAQDAQARYEAVSSRQDASEAEIEAARQEAAAAHAEAGEARQYAASARESVEGMRPVQATTGPVGVGDVDGQLWEQWDTLDRDQKLIGVWRWDEAAGVWRQRSMDAEYVVTQDVVDLTASRFRAQRLFAEVGEVQRLLVGDATNMLPDSAIRVLESTGASADMWVGSISGWTTVQNQSYMPIALRWNGGADERLTYRAGAGARGIPVKTGDQFHMSWYGWKAGGSEASFIRPRYMNAAGGFVAWGPVKRFSSGWTQDSHSWAVPEDTSIRFMEICFEGRGDSSERGHWGDFSFQRVQAGELTVDGLLRASEGVINRLFSDTVVATSVWSQIVRTRLLEADEALIGGTLIKDNAITVDKIAVTDELIFQIARGIRLEVGQLASNDIVGMTIRGGLIEGVQIVGSEVMTSTNWASSGGAIMRQDGAAGNFVAVDDSGTVTARLGGSRNELSNLSVDGDITARSMALAGELRVGAGGNGEGGLIPDGDLVRLQGRVPHAAGGGRDMYIVENSGRFRWSRSVSLDSREWNIVYDDPPPVGSRNALLTMSRWEPSHLTVASAYTRTQLAESFTVQIVSQGNAGGTVDFTVRYLAYWR